MDERWEPVPAWIARAFIRLEVWEGSPVKYIDGYPHVLKPEYCSIRAAAIESMKEQCAEASRQITEAIRKECPALAAIADMRSTAK